jgi:phenylalanyl-tRNA synthetase beta chain
VSESTQDIFLESAYFSPVTVRKTSRSHGIDTDSGYRFARGVDPDGALRGLNRASLLIQEVAGGEAFTDHHDFYPVPVKKSPVKLSVRTVSDRLGYETDEAKFVDFMKRLGCEIISQGQGEYEVLPPNFRFDLEQDMDLVEEYARLYGYEHIPEKLPVLASTPAFHDKNFLFNQKTSEVLRAQGFAQAFNFAFVGGVAETKFLQSTEALNAVGLQASREKIKIMNPLNEEMDVMRSSLSFGLFKNVNGNFHYGNQTGRLFEIGLTFSKGADGAYVENNRVGLAAWGQSSQLWTKSADHPLVFEVKAAAEALLKQYNISASTWVTPSGHKEAPAFLHPGQCAYLLVEGKKIGVIGTLHPALAEENKIRVPVALAEFDLDLLYKGQPRPYRIQSISKFPVVERDLALTMPRAQKVGEVVKEIRKSVGSLLVNVDVFDVYEGDKIEAGKKSVALRLWLQDKNATLQDAQVTEMQKKLLETLEKNFAITIR